MVYVSRDGGVNQQLSPFTVDYWKVFFRKAVNFVILFFTSLLEPFLEMAKKNTGSGGKSNAFRGSGSNTGSGGGGSGGSGKPNIHGINHRKHTAPPPGGG